MNKAITINKEDNLGVALADLPVGEQLTVNDVSLTLKQAVSAKHKFALQDMSAGDEMYMYGLVVGTASEAIAQGEAITVSNTSHKATQYTDKKTAETSWTAPDVSAYRDRKFMGFHRNDGQVGTSNNWLVFPMVFCENRNIATIKRAFEKALGYEQEDPYTQLVEALVDNHQNGSNSDDLKLSSVKTDQHKAVFENVSIKFITHQAGCGGTRQDSDTLCRLLAGYLNNPNVAGATVLSLGCQNAQVEILQDAINKVNPTFDKSVLYFDQQSTGSETELLEDAIKGTFKALTEANKQVRKEAPLSKLAIGLECGGSDGFSGISANPSLGHVSDMMAALGGKAILSEFPELCGVEQVLINRMTKDELPSKFANLMTAYSNAAEAVGSGFDMNPSPGNIKDGLITDAMKSAGAAKKGGNSPVNDILDYTEYVKEDGLSLLCTPGNDVESTTGLAGSGANIVLFTTGLGTPTGNPVVPVIKVSSNTKLAERMSDIIDVNTGPVIEGKSTIEEMGMELLDYIIEVASGRIIAKADQLKQEDFIPWKRGISL
ncbi:MAG: altronate dehydratase family protein [Reichenbachiella sp.]